MASNFIYFCGCTLFFLQCLYIQVGNAQRYSYESPSIAEKITKKELEMAGPVIEKAIDGIFRRIFKPSNGSDVKTLNGSNSIFQCVNALTKLTKNITSVIPCKYIWHHWHVCKLLYRLDDEIL